MHRLFSISPVVLVIGCIKTIEKNVFRKASICFSFVIKWNSKKRIWKADSKSSSNLSFNVNALDGKNRYFLKKISQDWGRGYDEHTLKRRKNRLKYPSTKKLCAWIELVRLYSILHSK